MVYADNDRVYNLTVDYNNICLITFFFHYIGRDAYDFLTYRLGQIIVCALRHFSKQYTLVRLKNIRSFPKH